MNRYGTALASTGRWMTSGERRATASLDRVLTGAVVATFLVTAASFMARASWLLELLTHFRFQLALGSVVLLLCALARRRLLTVALAGMTVAVNAGPLLPYVFASPASAEAAVAPVRLMLANVQYSNANYAALLEQIRERDPDIVGLLEVDRAWLDELSLESEYRHSIRHPEQGPYGIALYSKLPFLTLDWSPYVENGLQTAIAVELEIDQTPTTLVLAHVRAPTAPRRASLRNLQFEHLASKLKEDPNAARILLGDLNTTPWSPYYRQLASTAELRNAALGRGYRPTWPAGFSPLKIPIDHCLVSDALRAVSFDTGADFGSDHLPVVVDLTTAGDETPSNAAP